MGNTLYKAIFERIQSPVVITDRTGSIVDTNNAFLSLIGVETKKQLAHCQRIKRSSMR